jgi:hypothetical protein
MVVGSSPTVGVFYYNQLSRIVDLVDQVLLALAQLAPQLLPGEFEQLGLDAADRARCFYDPEPLEDEEAGEQTGAVVPGHADEHPPQVHVLYLQGEGDLGQEQLPEHLFRHLLD